MRKQTSKTQGKKKQAAAPASLSDRQLDIVSAGGTGSIRMNTGSIRMNTGSIRMNTGSIRTNTGNLPIGSIRATKPK